MRSEQNYHSRKAAKAAYQKTKYANRLVVRLSEPITLFSGVLMLATVGLVVVGIYQLCAIRGQLQAVQDDQRPWIRLHITSVDNLKIIGDNLAFGIGFEFVNSGKSPATDVEYEMRLEPEGDSISAIQNDTCVIAKISSPNTLYRIIFPNETGEWPLHNGLNSANAPKFCIPFGGPYIQNPDRYIAPVVVGCIVYKSPHVDGFHHTWFSYDVGPLGSLKCPGDHLVQGSDVKMSFSPWGRNDAD